MEQWVHGTKRRVLESYFSFSREEETLGEDGEKGREKKEMKKEKADVKIKG